MTEELKSKLLKIKHVALDMDGTIYLSNTIFPFTLDFLDKLGKMGIGYSFLTNNPTRSLEDYLAKLTKMGIKADKKQMYSTVPATIDFIKANYPSARKLFDVPDLLVVAFDPTLVYSRLCRAGWWAQQGIPYIATNPDRVCPTDQPTVLVDCGSLCACIEYATGRKPDTVIGKPDPAMIEGIEHRYGLEAEEIAMVGDRIYTDVECAYNAGAFGVLVLSGETTLEVARQWPHAPSLICRDIEELGCLLEEAHGLC